MNDEYKYIKLPETIKLSECIDNNYCFAPSKYSRFKIKNIKNYECLDQIIDESVKKQPIENSEFYYYAEIGDVNVETGIVDFKSYYGTNIPSPVPKKLLQNDIVISTVRTYRNGIGIIVDNDDNMCCSPALLVIRNTKKGISKEYLLSILRHPIFTEQILGFLNRGMYPRLDKEAIKHIVIPLPNKNKELTIEYIETLTKAVIQKEKLIKERHKKILELIENELKENQNESEFKYKYPSFSEISKIERIDTSLYTEEFQRQEFLVTNYKNGCSNIKQLGFSMSRGQNLQVSNIGESIYSKKHYKNFYTLMLPKFISKYGTLETTEYLGNEKALKTLKTGDLIFGAEGFEKGRSFVVIEEKDKAITNIHGITFKRQTVDLKKSIFVKCYMDYMRSLGLIDLYAVGGNGGSMAQKYWDVIPIPNFPQHKQEEIASLYYGNVEYKNGDFSLENFCQKDSEFNEKAGIYELDKSAKHLKRLINSAIDKIAEDKDVEIKF